MDKVVGEMGKAGIKVILGTPTYFIPTWLYREHPEIMARHLGWPPHSQSLIPPRPKVPVAGSPAKSAGGRCCSGRASARPAP